MREYGISVWRLVLDAILTGKRLLTLTTTLVSGVPTINSYKVGILTSHRCACGVAQYNERFAEALAKRDDVEPVILAGRADEHRSVPEGYQGEVHDVAKIGLWRDDQTYEMDYDKILSLDLDVIHVSYQSMLFDYNMLVELTGRFPGITAITYHDLCIPPGFRYDIFDLHFAHNWRLGTSETEIVPFGIENRPPVVRTFGLGRTRSDYIQPICERHGWVFETVASHEPIQGGGQRWRSHEDLIAWLRGADLLVLWYDNNDMAGSSQAARTAMASRRPLITNDTTWFQDLPKQTSHYRKVSTLEELESEMCAQLANYYVAHNSWDMVAATFVAHYQRRMAEIAVR